MNCVLHTVWYCSLYYMNYHESYLRVLVQVQGCQGQISSQYKETFLTLINRARKWWHTIGHRILPFQHSIIKFILDQSHDNPSNYIIHELHNYIYANIQKLVHPNVNRKWVGDGPYPKILGKLPQEVLLKLTFGETETWLLWPVYKTKKSNRFRLRFISRY